MLVGTAAASIRGSRNANRDLFKDILSFVYWSDAEFDTNHTWDDYSKGGIQGDDGKSGDFLVGPSMTAM